MRLLCAVLLLGLAPISPVAAWHVLPPGADGWARSGQPAMRGMTVGPIESIQRPGVGYGTEASDALLAHSARMGTNWISITPFGRIWDLQSTVIDMDFEAPYEENREAVRRMIHQAHAHGIKVLLIPHLWVETGGWRGEIDPGSPARWAAYQASYRDFVLAWARDAEAAGADALSIGVECKSWSGRFGGFWTDFISEVRANFSGLLTYSANWDEAEDVLFWHLLDTIGINALHPLATHSHATDEEYAEGAEAIVPRLRELTDVLQMPLTFVEVGYTTRTDAAVEPWLWPDEMQGVQIDEREQARALDAMFQAIMPSRFFSGFFVWRYYTDLYDVSQEAEWGFSPFGKQADKVIAAAFADQFGADPSPWIWAQ